MGNWFVWPMIVLCWIVAGGFAMNGNYPMAWVWLCYGCANFGFL